MYRTSGAIMIIMDFYELGCPENCRSVVHEPHHLHLRKVGTSRPRLMVARSPNAPRTILSTPSSPAAGHPRSSSKDNQSGAAIAVVCSNLLQFVVSSKSRVTKPATVQSMASIRADVNVSMMLTTSVISHAGTSLGGSAMS